MAIIFGAYRAPLHSAYIGGTHAALLAPTAMTLNNNQYSHLGHSVGYIWLAVNHPGVNKCIMTLEDSNPWPSSELHITDSEYCPCVNHTQ
jgi:hypothetical protein